MWEGQKEVVNQIGMYLIQSAIDSLLTNNTPKHTQKANSVTCSSITLMYSQECDAYIHLIGQFQQGVSAKTTNIITNSTQLQSQWYPYQTFVIKISRLKLPCHTLCHSRIWFSQNSSSSSHHTRYSYITKCNQLTLLYQKLSFFCTHFHSHVMCTLHEDVTTSLH